MKHRVLAFAGLLTAAFVLGSLGCSTAGSGNTRSEPIVGAWLVKDAAAPFAFHMYVFNADGTMQQANPDAGDANSSDSDGKGVWRGDGQKIRGKWVEVAADRLTRQFVGRGEYSYEIVVDGNRFAGPAVFRFYGVDGTLVRGPINSSIAGERVTLP